MQIRERAPSLNGSRIWIVDRSRLFLEGMRLLLAGSDLSVALYATNLDEVQVRAPALDAPDVILIGINTPLVEHGEELISIDQVCGRFGGTPVVVLGDLMSLDQLKAAMKAGASGYLLRSISAAALRHSLGLAISGEKVLPSELVSLLVHEGSANGEQHLLDGWRLSTRERAILRCLANGLSNKQIANQLNIAEGTVKAHIKAIFKKIHARNRTDAAVWALGHVQEVSD